MFNFYKSILSKGVYVDIANKVETIVSSWFNKLSFEEFKKYDFWFLATKLLQKSEDLWIEDYIKTFDPSNSLFDENLSYAMSLVSKKDYDELEYDYISSCMSDVNKNYDVYVDDFNNYLTSFKFLELDSISQSILLTIKSEYSIFGTPKAILIKEADMMASKFSTDSSIWMIHAVLDKVMTSKRIVNSE